MKVLLLKKIPNLLTLTTLCIIFWPTTLCKSDFLPKTAPVFNRIQKKQLKLHLSEKLVKLIHEVASQENVPCSLLLAICEVESRGKIKAFRPHDGGKDNHAFGLFQVLRKTGEDILRKKDPGCKINYKYKNSKDKIYNNCKLFGPKTNTRVAAKYFKKLLYRYNGSIDKAIAAYNRGHAERSKKTGKFVNQRYVDQVKSYLPQYQALTREAVLNT